MAVKVNEDKKFIFTSSNIEEITQQINDGYVIKRYQNPWFKNEVGVRRNGITFGMTDDELQEYIKCKLDIHYFAEKYCKIKREDGSIGHIHLRDYQKGILDLYTKNRFSILMSSRQSGKTINAAITMLHFITFNNDKNIMIVANIAGTAIEIIDKVKGIYINLPFFLKVGIKNWNQRTIIFDNGCRIKSAARSKTPAIGFTIDMLYLDEFAHIPSNIIEPYYTAVYPVVSAVENSKIIITSTPNGMNLFHKLLTSAERPDGDPLKNNYKAMRVYWHQVAGRFVTYYRLNLHKLHEYNITKMDVLEQAQEFFSGITKVEMKYNVDLEKDVISVYNNEVCTESISKSFKFISKEGNEIPIQMICEVTTWKEEAIKDIGGEDAFNQEYGLRFINSSRSLLSEGTIEGLLNNKKNYSFEQIYEFDKKIKFAYSDLKWVEDDNLFTPIQRKSIKGIISVDISEGLGQDYSIINIFRVIPKSKEIIEQQKHTYTNMSDFFTLAQIAIFRSNLVSVKQLAELFYLIVFEYFNYDNFKVVLEINNYGNEFLAHLPYVFEGSNNYGSAVFFRHKHRADAAEEKIGLKVGDNKNMLVRDYQDAMDKKKFLITNEDTVREITTFVKQVTTSGNIRYAADIGNDDCLLPDTLIKTINGYKKIKNINVDDLVLTHLGNYKRVTNICIKDFDGDMFNIKFRGQIELDITYNHPIYIATENYSRSEYIKGNYNTFLSRKWSLPKDIKSKHRCISIKDKICSNTNRTIHYSEIFERNKNFAISNINLKEIKLDSRFSKFLGLFLADGNCYKPTNTTYKVSISFNSNQLELIEEMSKYWGDLGLKSSLLIDGNSSVLTTYNKTLFDLLISCYDENKEKILPFYSNELGMDLKYVLEYWLKGDGWKYESKGRFSSVIGCSTSMQLALSMRDIALSIGKHAIINKNKRHRYGVKCKDQYWVKIYNERPKSSVLKQISNFEYSSNVEKIKKYHYSGVTYNLEVEDDNSYVANGIVVHNCVMTLVNASTIFTKNEYKQICEDCALSLDKETQNYFNSILKEVDYAESADYSSIININRQRRIMSQIKNMGGAWFKPNNS